MKNYLFFVLFLGIFAQAEIFQNEMWYFVYPDGWIAKREESKIVVSPDPTLDKSNLKLSLHHKKIPGELRKLDSKKLLEMMAISILSAEHQSMLEKNNEVEVRKVKRPKAEKDKTEKDRIEEKKLQEERKKQIDKKMQRELSLKDRYRILNKKEVVFLERPAIYIELEKVLEKETIQKQIYIMIAKDNIITIVLYFNKDGKDFLSILQKILQTLKITI